MVSFPIRPRLIVPVAPVVAFGGAIFVASLALFVPQSLLDTLVVNSGLPALLPAAEPPLGWTARLALMVTLGSAAGGLGWFAACFTVGGRAWTLTRPTRIPRVRRADPPVDVPSRAPLVASRELGTPFFAIKAKLAAPVERALPRDLDAPLSAYDPAAVPVVPAEPVPLVAPLTRTARVLAPGERIDAFQLPTPADAPTGEATIHALLDRLERGVATRTAKPARPMRPMSEPLTGLDATLGELRRLAVGR